jgi:excisionase family DNA binding protein
MTQQTASTARAENTELVHTVEAAIQRMHSSRRTIYALIATGELRSYQIGKRRYITEAAIRDLVTARERATAENRAL